ncbi:MAG: NAD(P)/FAD-dependent oxidoreductase [Gammaproteobacteria bacterium]
MPDNPDPIVIVGGGWAGLSCAVELVDLGHSVTLLESARQLGGRARRIAFDTHAVDNGQHILLAPITIACNYLTVSALTWTPRCFARDWNCHCYRETKPHCNFDCHT